MRISIESDLVELRRDLNTIGRKYIDTSASMAINKTMAKVRTLARNIISDQANLPKTAYINKYINIKKGSTYKTLSSRIDTKDARATNLIEYVKGDYTRFRRLKSKGGFNNFTKGSSRGVKARPYEKQQYFKGTFIVTGKDSGKSIVVKRLGRSSKSKLKAVYGPSLRRMFIQARTMDKLKAKALTEWPIEFNRALKLNFDRAIARGSKPRR